MPHPGAPPLLLRDGDHEQLTRLVRASSARAGLAQRARIVLLASEGMLNADIAERVGVSRPTVNRWRARYTDGGVAGLVDEDRPGRPRTIDQRAAVVVGDVQPRI
jgi:transposase